MSFGVGWKADPGGRRAEPGEVLGVRFNWNRTFFAGRIVLWFGLFMIIAQYEKICGGILESLEEFI